MSLPAITLPKFTEEGVAARVEEVAIALRSTTKVGVVALLVIETDPARDPVVKGLNVTVALALCPALNVIGMLIPVTLTPEPEKVMPEIFTLPVPELVSFTVCVASLPTLTFPKAIEDGETVKTEVVVPVPLSSTSAGESVALLVIAIDPDAASPMVGLNRAEIVVLWPALNAMGR